MSTSRVIVLALAGLVAGLALVQGLLLVRSDPGAETRAELARIRVGARRYCNDTRELPRALVQLVRHAGRGDWRGPYVSGLSDLEDLHDDGWGRPYRVASGAGQLRVTSAGSDGLFGTADDLEAGNDAAWSRREVTRARLRVIHAAIVRYTARHGVEDPLPADWPRALDRLVDEGFLPSREGLDRDAWGSAFEASPRGLAPLVRVRSIHLHPRADDRG